VSADSIPAVTAEQSEPTMTVLAEDRELSAGCITTCIVLRKLPTAWREQNDRTGWLQRVDRFEKWLGLHHHPRPTAIRSVIDGSMAVVREVSQVNDPILDGAGIHSSRRDAQ
jgi:hypothetical protein